MRKIVTVIGARPQFVKSAVVSRALADSTTRGHGRLREVVVHTGQHFDSNMSDVFFQEMEIPPPAYHLNISGGGHGEMTGRMLAEIERVLLDQQPDVVLVYGDTNSTLAGALAAAKLHIPVAHVEAGLRSFNLHMPEEINRILTDQVSRWLFCPTQQAVRNLEREGFCGGDPQQSCRPGAEICNVGDVMLDATQYYRSRAVASSGIRAVLDSLASGFHLLTIHRAENTDSPARLKAIMNAMEEIAASTPVIFPVHPRTRSALKSQGIDCRSVRLLDPVGYFDMLLLLEQCRAVFTDSGGLQKEAYFFQKPCLTLREETEWTELVESGWNHLVGADSARILERAQGLLTWTPPVAPQLYGTGAAANRIVEILAEACE